MTAQPLPPVEQRASLDQIARVQSSILEGGAAPGMRVIDVSLIDGMSFQVLPDRGLDIGAAWCASPSGRFVPVSWTSRLGAHLLPIDQPVGSAWITRFTGGLLTTCGIDNVGPASEGVGLHGSFSHRRASQVTVSRREHTDSVEVEITGTIHDADALSRNIRVVRRITSSSGQRSLRVEDTATNHGTSDEPIPLLYHLNFGAPFWSDGSSVTFADGTTAVARDADAAAEKNAHEFPGVGPGRRERVYEQVVPVSELPASIDSPLTGLVAELRWSQATLPRCVQWIHPASGVSALGIEPSNASVMGRAHDRSEKRLPILSPDDSLTTWVEIKIRSRDD